MDCRITKTNEEWTIERLVSVAYIHQFFADPDLYSMALKRTDDPLVFLMTLVYKFAEDNNAATKKD